MKITKLLLSRQNALLTKSVKLSKLIKYNSNTTSELTIDQTCTSSSCQVHSIILTKGIYKIELWGSQGGTAPYAAAPGNGSYVSGNFVSTGETSIFAFIGNRYSFNGGGAAGPGANSGANGGGATDIRLGGTELIHRILVAAGGGGGGGHTGYSPYRDLSKSSVGGNGDENGGYQSGGSMAGQPGLCGSLTKGGAGGAGGTRSFTRVEEVAAVEDTTAVEEEEADH
jgi:hypothetical protein